MWGDHIQCHYVPYKPAKKPLPKLTKKPAVSSTFVSDFSMKYTNDSVRRECRSVEKPPVSKVSKLHKLIVI